MLKLGVEEVDLVNSLLVQGSLTRSTTRKLEKIARLNHY